LNAIRSLSEQFRLRTTAKRYSAIVDGVIEHEEGEINLPIGKDKIVGPPFYTIDQKEGREAKTLWAVAEREAYCTKLSLVPKTGRTHQLRLHLAAIGHPILGDFFYSPPHVRNYFSRYKLSQNLSNKSFSNY
jgi:tRNA pseudouridine32 synthase / 23S rRNA pseudouridine746 synthase